MSIVLILPKILLARHPRWNWEHQPCTRSQHHYGCTGMEELDILQGGLQLTLFLGHQPFQGKLRCGLCHGFPLLPTRRPNMSRQVLFEREKGVQACWGCSKFWYVSKSVQVWELQLQQQRPGVWVGWGGHPRQQQHQQHQPRPVQRLQRTGGDTHPNSWL